MAVEKKILDNRYEIIQEVARGGFAVIYKGQDRRLNNRLVAIKKLRESFIENETALKMFLAEIDLTIRLEHPNIVRIYDTINEANNYYIILEYVDGVDLKKLIIKINETKILIPFNISAYILSETCKALHYAHNLTDSATGVKLGIVHRDISPQNILLSYKGEVKLTDFGIAKARGLVRGDSTTKIGMVKGKLSYMSPEQAQGMPIDKTADIYSLGLVMFELLSGKKLFNADTDHQLLQKVAKGGIDKRELANMNAPAPLKKILSQSLEIDRAKRFPNARDMKNEIDRHFITYENSGDELAQFITAVFRREPSEELESTITVESLAAVQVPAKLGPVVKKEERTPVDIIKVATHSAKKFALTIAIVTVIMVLGFFGLDTFKFQLTPMGREIYNIIFPPVAEIKTIPEGAIVVLDNRPLKQKTPARIPKIPPGVHKLKLVLTGYEPIQKTINIKGKKVAEGNKIFESFEVPIDIITTPSGASVYIDNNLYPGGVTPIFDLRKKIGEADIKIRLEYQNFKPLEGYFNLTKSPSTENKYFIVEKESGAKIKYRIQGIFSAECKIVVTPADARATINNEQLTLDNGCVTTLLAYGNNTLFVSKDGFVTHNQNIQITSGDVKSLNISLRRSITIYAVDKDTRERINGDVKIDGKTFATGMPIQLWAGIKSITISAPYYLGKTLTVDANKNNEIKVELDRTKPQLKIKVIYDDNEEPVIDAMVYLHTENKRRPLGFTNSKGELPRPEELAEGKYEIEITKEKSSKLDIFIRWGQENFFIIKIPR